MVILVGSIAPGKVNGALKRFWIQNCIHHVYSRISSVGKRTLTNWWWLTAKAVYHWVRWWHTSNYRSRQRGSHVECLSPAHFTQPLCTVGGNRYGRHNVYSFFFEVTVFCFYSFSKLLGTDKQGLQFELSHVFTPNPYVSQSSCLQPNSQSVRSTDSFTGRASVTLAKCWDVNRGYVG